MKDCDKISAFLDGRLEADDVDRFEAHLPVCDDCRREVDAWRTISERMRQVSDADAAASDPTTREQVLLVQRAELERSVPRLPVVRLALAASALMVLGALAGYLAGRPLPEPDPLEPEVASGPGPVYTTDVRSSTSVRLAADTIHLGPSSSVRVRESGLVTRLDLDRGSLACEVSERQGLGGFTVETPHHSVRVTGTRFLVELGATPESGLVVVAEGEVEVEGSGATRRLAAGQRLGLTDEAEILQATDEELTALERLIDGPSARPVVPALDETSPAPSETVPQEPSEADTLAATIHRPAAAGGAADSDSAESSPLERWRGWVIEGRLDEARSALREHLDADPNDTEAWSLLADCERKRGAWEEAVSAYDELVARSKGVQQNRARFKAAQLLQDRLGDHRRAADLLERYVEGAGGGSLLVDKARVRLARSLTALGQTDRARAQLLRVVERGTDAATVATARRLLERLDGK